MLVGVVAVLAGVGAIVAFGGSSGNRDGPPPPGPPGTQAFDGLSRKHTDDSVAYPLTPPVGGDHSKSWQNCGLYRQPVPPERAVHSMEHGAVWITYRPDLDDLDISRLTALTRRDYVLVSVSPVTDSPSPVVATAWGRQLHLGSAQDPRLDAFVEDFRRGPQTPEPGAPCTGGAGKPEQSGS